MTSEIVHEDRYGEALADARHQRRVLQAELTRLWWTSRTAEPPRSAY